MNTAERVTLKLIEENRSITFMESCTSGLLASMFTDTSGASAVFKGSYVTYSNEEKIRLGVNESVIKNFGVYSCQCARAMAETCQKAFNTDIAIGITGTTGNIDPENPDSVQGKAFFCIRVGNKSHDFLIEENVNDLSRAEIKKMYAKKVYDELFKLIS